jgi:PmbA protein
MDEKFISRLLDHAYNKGVDHAEVYLKLSKNLGIEVKGQEIDSIEKSLTSGYSLRIIKDNRLGFSYSTDFEDLERVVNSAINSSEYSEPDPYLDLPSFTEPSFIPAIYDHSLYSLSEEDAIDLVMLIEKTALMEDKRIKKIRKASGSFSTNEVYIENTKGLKSHYKSTACSAHIMLIAEDIDESQMGWDYQACRYISDLSFEDVGKTAAKKALKLLGSKKTTSFKGSVLLDNSVAVEFLGILTSMLSAESVQKKKSLLQEKIGTLVISDKLNIIDNGLIDRKIGSRPIDDEGVPTSKKLLIQKGVLKGFMHNTYTAKKDLTVSTGNAIRGGFSNLPSVGPTNLYLEAASEEFVSGFNDMIEAVEKGIYVIEAMGMHTANPISGDFSIGISGLLIQKGKIIYPVKEVMISGNILDLFKGVHLVGDDHRFYGNIGSPSLLIKNIDISG